MKTSPMVTLRGTGQNDATVQVAAEPGDGHRERKQPSRRSVSRRRRNRAHRRNKDSACEPGPRHAEDSSSVQAA